MMNVQNFLKQEFGRRKKFNAQYSLRAFARDLGLESSVVIKIINGDRNAGLKVCQQLEDKFRLPSGTFYGMRQQAPSEKEGEHVLNDQLHFNIISQWEYFTVLNLLECPLFIPGVESVSKALEISQERAEEVVSELKMSGLLIEEQKDNGTLSWKRGFSHHRTTHDIQSLALRLGNIEFLELAKKKLLATPLEKRDYSSVVFAIDEEMLPFVKEILAKFRDDLEMMLSRIPQKKNNVYQLNLQLFPLAKSLDRDPSFLGDVF
jgi:uncharacterized protein (TIGR02147 family)